MRYLVTSALPYINSNDQGGKHLGNLVGSMLPADVHARYLRSRGENVLFICGTDEHGTPAEIAAAAAKIPVAEFCTEHWKKQSDIYARFNLSFDLFGRTSNPANHETTQYLAKKLEENGFIEERTIKQFYSNADGRFLPDRYVSGTCPFCGYERARGDQCENCTKVLDPEQLINPYSSISGSRDLEMKETKHLFLLQSKLAPKLREWLATKHDFSKLATSIALKWLDEGLQDRGITRDLSWGVKVQKPGFEGKVFYVWFDAPIGYISITKDWAAEKPSERNWHDWWDADADVYYTQFMGKDNIPFHSINFPATLLGAGGEFHTVDKLAGFNWLNYYGSKFSTSQNYGIFLDQALALYPADYWRYALMANMPETSDSSFTWEGFADAVNKDLADMLGNFVQRSMKMQEKYFPDGIVAGGSLGEPEKKLEKELAEAVRAYSAFMAQIEFRKAVQALRGIWKLCNEYFAERAPWTAAKEGRMDDVALSLRTAFNLQRLMAVLSEPFIPEIAGRMMDALGLSAEERRWPSAEVVKELAVLQPGRKISSPGMLVQKILPEEVEAHKTKFGGEK